MDSIFGLQIVLVAQYFTSSVNSICSSVYGAKPCPFVPAPPGEAPPCARPGLTYCEYPVHYPRELVQHLVEKWHFDHSTLLLDESFHELNNFFRAPDIKHGFHTYGPPQNNIHSYTPDLGHPSNAYIPPLNYTLAPTKGSAYGRRNPTTQHFHRNPWHEWNERNRKYYMRKRRSLRRTKRQSSPSGQSLCPSRSSYIMPRAALNSKGNWMYVVNLPEVDNRYTQLVKSETCVSQQCSNLCGLPDGYASRCEQKYVQKRLVAVDAGGGNLYSDVFWFPSCCVCTIVNNN